MAQWNLKIQNINYYNFYKEGIQGVTISRFENQSKSKQSNFLKKNLKVDDGLNICIYDYLPSFNLMTIISFNCMLFLLKSTKREMRQCTVNMKAEPYYNC